jgi:gamma-glutamylcyclotransferase (GGCT)/AIG2-like uncharacterized protein YtfP
MAHRNLLNLLFTYGTLLHQAENQVAQYLRQNSRFLGKGSFAGRLYDVGAYPGAVVDAASPCRVWGEVILLEKPEKVLPVLDEYEGYDESYPLLSEFVRKRLEITQEQKQVICWGYLYNLPTAALPLIQSGDYSSYLAS